MGRLPGKQPERRGPTGESLAKWTGGFHRKKEESVQQGLAHREGEGDRPSIGGEMVP